MEILATRLKELRLEKGLTQTQLAKETGLSQGAITFWETNTKTPSAQALVTLSRYFGVSVDYLLGETD